MSEGEGCPYRAVAIIPAAGQGKRMGAERPKQFLELKGKSILAVTLEAFERAKGICGIVVVVPAQEVAFCEEQIVKRFGLSKVVAVVPGGKRRQDSVRIGLEAAGSDYGLVAVHDGVRPFVNPEFIDKLLSEAAIKGAVVAAVPATDTVKEVDQAGHITKTYDRQKLWLAQTSQVFPYEVLLKAHQRALREGWDEATDDAFLVEQMGVNVTLIEGSPLNIKVTTPSDLILARAIMENW